ncbi:putative polysaccharide biosynthesis protein [Marinilactibacillus kalidii]|uniref:putative polysaccharide biosynthesis protein n=1 Tax=Marinilactibacillus kalidii TaxID=2820274 RepID=UPI001ABE45B7|nr:polysaccharide biosynthesis protein [Marinilactibacillus kalidii]
MSEGIGKQHNHMMQGAIILSVAAFITKVLSAVYKVPFQNLTGDEGFYVYQQVYPLYGIAVAFALNGFPLFVSKLIAEEKALEEQQAITKLVSIWLAIGSISLFLLFFFGAAWVAEHMGDPELLPVIRSVSYVYLFVPFLSSIRGYFQGNLDMIPTGISQVGEQVARIGILLAVAYLFTVRDWTVYQMGTYAIASSWIAGFVGSAILLWYTIKKVKWQPSKLSKSQKGQFWKIGKRLVVEGLPLTAMSSMMVLFQLMDSFTVYNGLVTAGVSDTLAMSLKGIYDRGQPFVQLGLVVGLGISTSALPLLRKYRQEKKSVEWENTTFSVLNLTVLFSGAASIGLIAVMPWINQALFSDRTGTAVLQVYVISIFVASLISSTHAILQSDTEKWLPAIALFVGLIFKATVNERAVEYAGIMGSSYLTILALLLVLVVMNIQMPKTVWLRFIENGRIIKIIALLLIMGIFTYVCMIGLDGLMPTDSRMSSFLLTIVGTIIGGIIFIAGLIRFDLLSEQEWRYIPFKKVTDKLRKNDQE